MSDSVAEARAARETLARALRALQSDPSVPPALMAVAEPVAQAMGALHTVERSGPAAPLSVVHAARDCVRQALGMLQAQTAPHPAISTATEAVAGSLGIIFGLVRSAEAYAASAGPSIAVANAPPPPQQAPAASPYAGAPAAASPYGYSAGVAPQHQVPVSLAQPPAAYPQPAAAPQQHHAPQPAAYYPHPAASAPQAAAPSAAVQSPYQHQQPSSVQGAAQAALQGSAGYAPIPGAAGQQPAAQAPYAQPMPPAAGAGAQAAPVAQQASASAGQQPALSTGTKSPSEMVHFEASLGTNSASNFYKGLSGNDVVEHGGLFVATYNKMPKPNTPVALHVSLPGGYEFDALAMVMWTREQRGIDASDASPGFGARFTQISSEARQLVYRYVRNREPLFHDDFLRGVVSAPLSALVLLSTLLLYRFLRTTGRRYRRPLSTVLDP